MADDSTRRTLRDRFTSHRDTVALVLLLAAPLLHLGLGLTLPGPAPTPEGASTEALEDRLWANVAPGVEGEAVAWHDLGRLVVVALWPGVLYLVPVVTFVSGWWLAPRPPPEASDDATIG